jgi:two-component system, NarL family, response regulator LiaR
VINSSIRVLLVDDHVIVREGLRMLLAEESDIEVIGEAVNGAESVELAAMLHPSVVLMDLVMPGMDGIQAIQDIRIVSPSSQVLVLTSFGDDQRVRDAIHAGAIGYLLKDVLKVDLLRAIRASAQGLPTLHPEAQRHLMRQLSTPTVLSLIDGLTPRERDVLQLIVRGQSNKEIAASLRITEGTIKGHVSTILSKLAVADRTQAALYAVRHGFEADA